MKTHPLRPLLACLAATGAPMLAQAADISGLELCRMKDDPQMRLACYDELPLPAQAPVGALRGAPPPIPVTPAPNPANFGFEAKAAQGLTQVIDTFIEGRFDGWGPKSRIRLANGQVWQVVDDSNAVMSLDNPRVQIRRGVIGGFYIEFERSNRTARVRRLE